MLLKLEKLEHLTPEIIAQMSPDELAEFIQSLNDIAESVNHIFDIMQETFTNIFVAFGPLISLTNGSLNIIDEE